MGKYEHRLYDVFLAVGRPKGVPLYYSASWVRLFDVLDPFVRDAPRQPAGVRTTQVHAGTWWSFACGRLKWGATAHDRWAWPPGGCEDREFLGTEVWVPTWNACGRDDLAPDVFVSLQCQPTISWEMLQVAVHVEAGDRPIDFGDLATTCRDLLAEPLLLRTRRYWGRTAFGGFANAIQDYFGEVAHALRNGAVGATAASLPGKWEEFRAA